MSLLIRPITHSSPSKDAFPFKKTLIGQLPRELIIYMTKFLTREERYTLTRVCLRLKFIVLDRGCWTPEIHSIMTVVIGRLMWDHVLPKNMTIALNELTKRLSFYKYPDLYQIAEHEPLYANNLANQTMMRFLLDALGNAWRNVLNKNNVVETFTIESGTGLNTYTLEGVLLGLIRLKTIKSLNIKGHLTSGMVKCLALTLHARHLDLESLIIDSPHLESTQVNVLLNALSCQTNLKNIEFTFLNISETNLNALVFALRNSTQMATLKCGYLNCSNLNSRAFANVLLLPSLRRIEVKQFTGNLLPQLCSVLQQTKVKEIIMHGGKIDLDTCTHLYHLYKERCNLDLLDLRQNKVTDQRIKPMIMELWNRSRGLSRDAVLRKDNLTRTL